MASPQPRIGVVTYPGSQDDRDALWALAALDAEAVSVWHEEHELPDIDAVVLPGRLLVRRLPPLRRDRRGSRRRRPPCASSPRPAASCSGSATASRSCARRGCCRACCCGTSRSASSAATYRCWSSGTTSPSPARCTTRRRLVMPVKHGDGRYVPPSDLEPVAGRPPLRRQPERIDRRHRRSLQRGRKRHGAHAAPRARGRSAARLGRRRSAPRLARRRRARTSPRPRSRARAPPRVQGAWRGRLSAVRCLALGGSPARACRRRRPRRRSGRAARPSRSRAAGPSMRTAWSPPAAERSAPPRDPQVPTVSPPSLP